MRCRRPCVTVGVALFAALSAWEAEAQDEAARSFLLTAVGAAGRRDYANAVESYGQALLVDPKAVAAYQGRSEARHCMGDIPGAIADLTKALELAPRSTELHVDRATLFLRAGRLAEAEADVAGAEALDKADPYVMFGRAWLEQASGQTRRARSALESLAQAKPGTPRVAGLSMLLRLTEELEATSRQIAARPRESTGWSTRSGVAIRIFRLARRIEPSRARRSWLEQAVRDAGEAIYIHPEDPAAFSNRGLAYHDLGCRTEALRDLGRAIELAPKVAAYHVNRSACHASADAQSEQASADAARALELGPSYAPAWCNSAALKSARGDHRGALAEWTRAKSLDPRSPEGLAGRGACLVRLGRHDQAISDLDAAIRLAPGDPDLYMARGDAYARLADHAPDSLFGRRRAYVGGFSGPPDRANAGPPATSPSKPATAELLGRAKSDFETVLRFRPADPAASDRLAAVQEKLQVEKERRDYVPR